MDIQKEMVLEVKREWGNIIPYDHCTTLSDVNYGYNFSCHFSVGDFEEQRKIVIGIANLSLCNYEVATLTSIGNVELVESICQITKKIFPQLSFDGYRDMVFDILDEIVVPTLEKYGKCMPSCFQLLDAGSIVIDNDEVDKQVSYSISTTDIKFNYKMVPLIEDFLRKEEAS
ncbi:hypothetical protein [Paenibacillus sp. KR2-11]|uniref:hypothetical protein n=1 Tax=Paenibacillus sp. KR2-11 TaxID=3385500 RepID=UPI0038FCCC33